CRPPPGGAWPPRARSRRSRKIRRLRPLFPRHPRDERNCVHPGDDVRGIHQAFFFFAPFSAAAARISVLNASALISTPSGISIARLVLPSRLELNSFAGSFSDAPL